MGTPGFKGFLLEARNGVVNSRHEGYFSKFDSKTVKMACDYPSALTHKEACNGFNAVSAEWKTGRTYLKNREKSSVIFV